MKNRKYQAILFDLDGTLLPMETEGFTKGYFKFLFAKLAKYGLEAQSFGKLMWAGVAAMVKNDGRESNEDAFWHSFEAMTGLKKETVNPDCLEFYGKEFHAAKQFTGENPLAKEAVDAAHLAAQKVVLATNPLFPLVGQQTRMSWIGLSSEDFDLVTSYETDCYCKPNPLYFQKICERLSVDPKQCLMIGNDETEDMAAASAAGLDCYLVTDWKVAGKEKSWEGPQGSFTELVEMLHSLA